MSIFALRGRAESPDLTMSKDEFAMASWFTREEINKFGRYDFQLPRKLSIARRLIDDWPLER